MAGDWIKWEKGLVNKPEVVQIARRLGIGAPAAAAHLMCVWEWADGVTETGHVEGVTLEDVDAVARMPGIGAAMCETRPHAWLIADGGGIVFPNYERHNGESAKARALAAKRMGRMRDRTGEDSGYRPWHRR